MYVKSIVKGPIYENREQTITFTIYCMGVMHMWDSGILILLMN